MSEGQNTRQHPTQKLQRGERRVGGGLAGAGADIFLSNGGYPTRTTTRNAVLRTEITTTPAAQQLPPELIQIIVAYIVGQRFLLVFGDQVCFVFDFEESVWFVRPMPGARPQSVAVQHQGVVSAARHTSKWVDTFDLATLTYRRDVEALLGAAAGGSLAGDMLAWDSTLKKLRAVACAALSRSLVTSRWCHDGDWFTGMSSVGVPRMCNWRTMEDYLFPPLCNPRKYAQIVRMCDTFYVCGGTCPETGLPTASCEIYNPKAAVSGGGRWQPIAALRHARQGHMTFVVNQQFVVVVGGDGVDGGITAKCSTIERYDSRTNCWTILSQTPVTLAAVFTGVVV